jgi:sulfotransferase famil protein
MKRQNLPHSTYGIVLPDWHIVFVVAPKSGCTSILWALSALQAEGANQFWPSLSPEVTRGLTIHDRSLWQRTRSLSELSDGELEAITADNGWAIIGVTRNPLSRLWSAWQSKLLLREPWYAERFTQYPWFPRPPTSIEQVSEDFNRFAVALGPDNPLLTSDPHWLPQSTLLNVSNMTYTYLGRMETLADTFTYIESHLRVQGWNGTLPRLHENSGILPLTEELLGPGVMKHVVTIYQSDYENFGYPIEPALIVRPTDGDLQSPNGPKVFEAMRHLVDRHERIGDLRTEALSAATRSDSAEADLERLTSRMKSLEVETERIRSENKDLVAALERSRGHLDDLQHQLAAEHIEVNSARRALERIQQSRTLRYTLPFRRMYAALRQRQGDTA